MTISQEVDMLNPKDFILIKGAGLHNLKDIDVAIPRNKMVVITGLSGSGKSSLAFDTLYAEGQRRYVESLSSYARQFLGRLDKPKVTYIKGISPAIAIEQKVNTTNARSTVGTSTEIYDYIKLLYARIGKTISPISGEVVEKQTVTDVVNKVKSLPKDSRWLLLANVQKPKERSWTDHFKILQQQGFARLMINDKQQRLDAVLEGLEVSGNEVLDDAKIALIIDRVVVQTDEDFLHRLGDAVQIAFFEGKGTCQLRSVDTDEHFTFDMRFSRDGIDFLEPNVHLFSFNNPFGACPTCEGYGNIIGIDEELVIPNTALSVFDNAVSPWRGESMNWYKEQLINNAYKFDFPIHKPYFQLTETQKKLLWKGNSYFVGIDGFFKEIESKNYKIQNRVLLSRYRGKTKCPDCEGKRLRPEAFYVHIGGKNVGELVNISVDELIVFFNQVELNEFEQKIAKRLLIEIRSRLQFLKDVGLGYLTLNRNSATLSGGESQRINLATSLGSSLVGSMYILDEPSIGLHPRDTERLIFVLRGLQKLGNTVIVVEHDEDIMRQADHIIDIGPEAGTQGGIVVAEGKFEAILKSNSLTSKYLNGKLRIDVPTKRRSYKNFIEIVGARANNLKNIDVVFPLDCFTVVTGVSGSGKSTLVKQILYPALQKKLTGASEKAGQFTEMRGSFQHIGSVEYVDQNPIGRSSRSNPVTYIKAYDEIRDLFSKQKLSKIRNYQPKHFSFNVEGGRCETCQGEGIVTIEMQFMADVHLECETCQGKRFKKETLEVTFEGKNIHDILQMTIDDAISFFENHKQQRIVQKILPLQQVGLGYVQLGQSSATLSGGEAQRIKLASFLVKGTSQTKTLFLFDEPTTGLHFHDIKKLLKAFDALIEKGHSIIVIEHNLDLIKCADYIIDIGPNGGDGGGKLIAFGHPEDVVKSKRSAIASYLSEKLS